MRIGFFARGEHGNIGVSCEVRNYFSIIGLLIFDILFSQATVKKYL